MAFSNAQASRVLYGPLHLSGLTRNAKFDHKIDQLEVTTLADTAKQFIPGMEGSSMSVDMLLDDNSSVLQLGAFNTQKGSTDYPFTLAPYGLAALSNVVLMSSLEATINVSESLTGTANVAITGTTDGATDYGFALENLTAVTTTANGTARDLTAASANGGIGQIHVTAFSGLTSDTVTIEHSVDGSTAWATLVTFTAVTGATSEQIVVAAGTTVRRFLRVVDTVVGTGSCTRQVSFARR